MFCHSFTSASYLPGWEAVVVIDKNFLEGHHCFQKVRVLGFTSIDKLASLQPTNHFSPEHQLRG